MSGYEEFHDWNESSLVRWEMDLDTTFYWNGSCRAPAISSSRCWVRYTIATDITNQKRYDYTTNLPSHAKVYSGLVVEHYGLGDLTFPSSQRRECQTYDDCYWTQWDGW